MKHARLQPSAAHRWAVCPGSVALCAAVPDRGSEAADQGTACHVLLGRLLRGDVLTDTSPASVLVVDEEKGSAAQVEVTDAMRRWVSEAAGWVRAALDADPRLVLRTEAYSPVGRHFGRPADLFGHSDVVLVGDRELTVVDAKFGYVEVAVEENPQLTLYALGHAEEYNWRHERYRLGILQPRSAQPVKVEVLTEEQLRDRGERLRPLVAEALAPDASLVPSDECRGCPAAGGCPELQKRAAALARRAFTAPRLLKAAELAAVLDSAPEVRLALDAAEAYASTMLSAGQKVPGWKLVAGQGRRAWKDEAEAVKALRALGLEPFQKKLLSPNQAEEKLGAKGGLLTALAPKAPGKPTLAPESDARPALQPAFQPVKGKE